MDKKNAERLTALTNYFLLISTTKQQTILTMTTLPEDIITPRLILRLINKDIMEACLNGKLDVATRELGAAIPAELMEHPGSLIYSLRQLANDPLYAPWSARAIILSETRQMIGLIRFHSSPNPEYLQRYVRDAVEFGYEVFPAWQRQHYATETLEAVMTWAQRAHGIHHFVASVSPENTPSLQLIARFGFHKIGEEIDETDGMEYVFLRTAD